MSLSVPPSSVSLPPPPVSVSLPLFPVSVSLPLLPVSTSWPMPPLRVTPTVAEAAENDVGRIAGIQRLQAGIRDEVAIAVDVTGVRTGRREDDCVEGTVHDQA